MTADAIPAVGFGSRAAGGASLVLSALLVAAAGAYAGAASELGASGVALGCALVALPATLALRGEGEVRFSSAERFLLALSALAALQALPMPAAVARILAPYAHDARDRGLGVDGGVRASLDAGATWRAALVILGIAFLLRAIRTAGAGGLPLLLARALTLVLLGHAAVALFHGSYGQRDTLIGGFEASNPLTAWGTFVNRLQFSAYAVALLGPAFVLVFASPRVLDRILGVVAGTTGIVAIALSGSRAGLASAGFAIAFAITAAAPQGRRVRVVGVFAVLAAAVVGLRAAGWGPLERILPLRPGEEKRLEIWRGSLDLASRQPVLGVGASAFRYAYAGDDRPVSNRWVTTAESDVLQAAAEGGLVGLLLLALAARSGWRALAERRRVATESGRRASLVGLSGVVGLVPLVLLASPLHAPAVALALAAAWALAGALATPAGAPAT